MSTIKNIPNCERPYEKLEMLGEKTLSNSELLAIIIKTGTKNKTAIEIAQEILSINSIKNIRELQDLSLEELKRISGIGKVKALQIKAVCELAKRMEKPLDLNVIIKRPNDVAKLLMNELRYEKREIVKLLILNTKNVLQKVIDINIGETDKAKVDIKRVLEETLKTGMTKFILVHNHPSGNVNPSFEDLETTEKVANAAKLVDLQLVDHIIIGDGCFYSIFSNKHDKGEGSNETIFTN